MQIIIIPRIKPKSTPSELSKPFRLDFCITLENMGVNKDKKIKDKINANDMVIKISNSQLSNTISSRMGTLLKCGLNIGVKKIAKNPDRIQFNIAKIS